MQLFVAALTFIGGLIAAYNSYLSAGGPNTPDFTKNAAPITLFIAFVLAVAKLRDDMKLR